MTSYLLFLLLGLGSGAVYALLGLGIVLEYRSSGVVNFAHGAMGMLVAYVYRGLKGSGDLWLLVGNVHLGAPLALWPALLASLAFAAVLGAVIYLAVFRPMRSASALGKVVATVGLALAMEALAALKFGSAAATSDPLLSSGPVSLGGDLVIPRDRLWLTAIAVAIAVLLWLVARLTRFGLATRAAAESEKGAMLLGYSPTRIAVVNWMLATVVAGLAGILLIQITGLTPGTYTSLVIPALAAAMLARFSSFAGVVAAALLLGMLQSETIKLGTEWSWLPDGIGGTLPFLMIMVAMVVSGQALPMRGVLLERRAPRAGQPKGLIAPTAMAVALTLLGLFALNGEYRLGLVTSLISALLCLSLVVLTGYAGQVSLAQMAFAGIGGFTAAKLGDNLGLPFPLPLLGAGAVAVPVGLIVGLPALRARGINLAIATMAAALAVDQLVSSSPGFNGGSGGAHVPKLTFLGLDFDISGRTVADYPRPWFGVFVLVVLVLVALSVANLRRSPTGRSMLAVRANERAAAAAGVDVAGTKLFAFAVASFIAGVGGGVLGYQLHALTATTFNLFTSLSLIAIAFVGGIARVSGAVTAGVLLAANGLVATLLDNAIGFGKYQPLIAGLLLVVSAIAYPDGIAATGDAPLAALRRRLRRRSAAAAVESAEATT